jgi:hypothetical protein
MTSQRALLTLLVALAIPSVPASLAPAAPTFRAAPKAKPFAKRRPAPPAPVPIANITGPYDAVGVGASIGHDGRTYWCTDFARLP